MTENGFVKAQSDNLPKIDAMMLFSFLSDNPDFFGAKLRGEKMTRSGRESYGDNAIGYVQLKRQQNVCIVKGKITPKHSVRKKAYTVTLMVNEREEQVKSVNCEDCAAAAGGCKHAVAFLTWVHRRSEEPVGTSVACYWKKSTLSGIGTSLKFIKAKDLVKHEVHLVPGDGSFLATVIDHGLELGRNDTEITKYYKQFSATEQLSIHHLLSKFFTESDEKSSTAFLEYCKKQMCVSACSKACVGTTPQSDSVLWFELRYARVTASKVYKAVHCKVPEGSVVEAILGARKLKSTPAMERGILLESAVIREVQKRIGEKIKRRGILLNPKYPIIGASPDGLTSNCIVEIKCPSTEKSIRSYITTSNNITSRYFAKVQMQMFLFEKKNALFCVANPDFEISKVVHIINVAFDPDFAENMLKKCEEFWCNFIFTMIQKNYV